MLRSMMYVATPSGCSLRRIASASMPIPIRSSERNISRAWCLVKGIKQCFYSSQPAAVRLWSLVQFCLWWRCGTAAPGCVGFKKHRRGRLCHTDIGQTAPRPAYGVERIQFIKSFALQECDPLNHMAADNLCFAASRERLRPRELNLPLTRCPDQPRLLEKLRGWRSRQDFTFVGVAEEQAQAFQVLLVERVIHVLSQVVADQFFRQVQPGGPRRNNFRNMLEAVVARPLKESRDLDLRRRPGQRVPSHRPESEHKRVACPAPPLLGQIVNEITFRPGLERRIAD